MNVSHDTLIVLPLLIPLATAVVCLMQLHRPRVQSILGILGAVCHCAACWALFPVVLDEGVVSTAMANWPAPYGVVFVVDVFSAVLIAMTGGMGVVVAVYAWRDIGRFRIRCGFFPVYHVLLAGVSAAFSTGDLFNLYVWFEVILMSSFVLMVLGGERAQLEGAVKYAVMNLLSSVVFLSAVGILYGKVGTLNMADLSVKLASHPERRLVTAASLMLLTAFGTKAGLFPLFFWLPASYHTPPAAVTTIFSALLTKVGIYSIVRTFTLVFQHDEPIVRTLLFWMASLTMITGVLGALSQYHWRRLLSFHIISQMGYLVLGLALAVGAGTSDSARLGLAAVLYFTVHVAVAKAALFLVNGTASRLRGTNDLKKLGGLFSEAPFLSILFAVAALSLAGIPPLSGFVAKYTLLRAGLEAGAYVPVGAALLVSLLTLLSMVKIWDHAFWKPVPEGGAPSQPLTGRASAFALYAPIVALVSVTVLMGLGAQPLMDVSLRAASQLLDPSAYIDVVLGVTP